MFIEIKLIGEVALEQISSENIGYKYDVPFDELDIPFLPIGNILRSRGLLPEHVQMGSAYPEGYLGITKAINSVLFDLPDANTQIRAYFTNSRIEQSGGYMIRSLKAGQRLRATIDFPEEMRKQVKSSLEAITQIGICEEGITGEIEISLKDNSHDRMMEYELNDLCSYCSLDYSFMLLTPLCIDAPFADHEKALDHVPGAWIRDKLIKRLSPRELDEMIFSNAYISNGKQRLLPTPICTAVIKLDKSQLRYRLAPGKDPEIVEQDVGIGGTFTDNAQSHLVKHTSPDYKRITTADGKLHDALNTGQIFSGTIYGPDPVIRKIVEMIGKNAISFIGDHTMEGFGEVYCMVDRVNEKEIPSPYYTKSFDLVCMSETLIINDDGMPTCRGEDLLREIEYMLGVENILEITGKYTDIYHDFSRDARWGDYREVARCFARGSVLRIGTKDDQIIDIAPILHSFIGERTKEGYGEIMAFPAKGQYYRLAENIPPVRYSMDIPLSSSTTQIGAHVVSEVITGLLKQRVYALAMIDRSEYRKGIAKEDLVPTEILKMLKKKYDPLISDEEVTDWYMQGLEVDYV